MAESEIPRSWCTTRPKFAVLNFTWTIEDAQFYLAQKSGTIRSSCFPVNDAGVGAGQYKWYLRADFGSIYVGLHLHVTSERNDPALAEFSLAIRDKAGEAINIHRSQKNTHFKLRRGKDGKKDASSGWDNFIRHNMLSELGSRYLHDGKLTFICELKEFQSRVNVSGKDPVQQYNVPACNFAQNFETMLFCERFSDVTIIVEEKEIRAHKIVLAARSPVFDAMFNNTMRENLESRVDIEDFSYDEIQELLRYIYTGKVPKLQEQTNRLLVMSDKYDLSELKTMCEQALGANLSIESAGGMLILADTYDAAQLKAHAMQFILNNASEAMDTEQWKLELVKYPHLLDAVCRGLAERKDGRPQI
ncbi:speckle-type POZ protein-like [Ochlerotatus camptorhynchus]|uniref:speckle-type POZ protein-like n=1 Tax=Ochlerotatus camptorhynchus TaxID=644619 RepID=UPI0031D285B5